MIKIAIFASHGGTDMQAITDGCKEGKIDGKVVVVISNNSDAYVLTRARNEGIDNYCINSSMFSSDDEMNNKILELLEKYEADIIFLAGYLKKIGIPILRKYENRIFNIHPALLPKYGGRGMYGMNVHRAVIEAGEKVSGVTIHRVNEEYDSGDIIAQTEVMVRPDDTPESLAAHILECEHIFLVQVLKDISNGCFIRGTDAH